MSVAVANRQLSLPLTPTTRHRRSHFIDPLDNETPREARARVARELAEGKRCTARMFRGGPCSLLLPCASHKP